jgi:hypothetical protein
MNDGADHGLAVTGAEQTGVVGGDDPILIALARPARGLDL